MKKPRPYPENFRDKFALYERAIQDPEDDVQLYAGMYRQLARARGDADPEPRILREDFCGTFSFACAWVKRSPRHEAIALDLDTETLDYGKRVHLSRLSPEEQKRVSVLRKNVISVTRPPADLIVAGNFSFFYLKEWETLVRYFENAHASLKGGGMFFLELAGGAQFVEKSEDRRACDFEDTGKYTYVWEQRSFDPITHEGEYAIHFRLADGSWMRNAFVYPWRLWSIPEARRALQDAGFRKTHVFWEKQVRGENTGKYAPAEHAPNETFWLCYVVGEK